MVITMKLLKKCFLYFLTFLQILIIPMSAFACVEENVNQSFSISEEEIIHQLQSMSDTELLKVGYTTEQIEQIRSFDYFDELSKVSSLDDETLLLYRYTPDEITELRSYIASGGKSRKTISPNTLTISLYFKNKTVGKQADVVVNWEWKRTALIKFIDCVAAAWNTTNGDTINYIPNDKNQVIVNWSKINPNSTEPDKKTATSSWQVNNNQSIYAHIPMGNTNYFAFSGTGTFTIKSTSGTFKEFYMDYGYAHYSVSVKPSISLSKDGLGVSLGFKGGLSDNRHIKRIYNASFGIVANY